VKTLHSIVMATGLLLCLGCAQTMRAQSEKKPTMPTRHLSAAEIGEDTLKAETIVPADTLVAKDKALAAALPDTTKHHKRNWATWKPETKRALWLALVLPGAGQIYNRKYWKLPIFYGGFVGCAYAMRWNNMMYRDYSQAYLDIMDNDPNTQSYNQFLHLGTKIDESNMSRWQEIFRQRKDRYRRWRDLSFFVMVGVYALSVIDAYVDASLSEFDISPDLSLHVAPAVINNGQNGNLLRNTGLGMQCAITF
jgi:hypothetical protein